MTGSPEQLREEKTAAATVAAPPSFFMQNMLIDISP
jgi:hypothetical protein